MAEDDIKINFTANTDSAVNNIEKLSQALSTLRDSQKGGFSQLQKAATGLNEVAAAAAKINSSVPSNLTALASAITTLKNSSSGGSFQKTATGVSALMKALQKATVANPASMTRVSTALRSLSGIKISNSSFKGLEKLPSIIKQFDGLNFSSFQAQVTKLTSSLSPLAAQIEKLAIAWKQLPSSLRSTAAAARTVTSANKSLSTSTTKLTSSVRSANGVFSSMKALLGTGMLVTALYKIRDAMADSITKVNEYVESMNLAQTVMGGTEFTKMAGNLSGIEYQSDYNIQTGEGNGFWTQAQELMGIDSAEAIKYQAVFEDVITGMGVARSQAEKMSQQLTQLGYDISSFNNISVSEAMQKIQSGVSGELEPMRRIGYDLSVARLQQDAYKMSLDQSVSSMTQAEKVQLRYYEMITQITEAHGDLARTLNSPANQIRILQAQMVILARNVGALLLPALNAIVPVLTAIVKLAQEAVISIAALFNVDLSDYFADLSTVDYSSMLSDTDDAVDSVESVTDALSDATDTANGATAAIEEYKNTVMGFDELNKLNDVTERAASTPTASASTGATATPDTSGSGGLDLSDLGYNFFEGLVESNVAKALDAVRDKLKTLLPIIAGVGAGFLAWKIGSALLNGLPKINKLLKTMSVMTSPIGTLASNVLKFTGALGAGTILAAAAAVAVLVTHFTNLFINSEKFRDGLSALRAIIDVNVSAVSAFASGLSSVLGPAFSVIGDAAYQVLSVLAQIPGIGLPFGLIKSFIDLIGNLGGAFEAVQKIFGALVDFFDLGWSDIMMVGTGAALILTGHPVLGGIVLALEAVSVAVRGMGSVFENIFGTITEKVDPLKDVSDETAEAFGNSLDTMQEAITEIDAIDFADAVVSQDDVDSISSKITDIKDTILNNLDAKRNEELANMDFLEGYLSEEKIQEGKDKINELYDGLEESATTGSARITEIMANASAEERTLTDEEAAEIKRIRSEMQQVLIESSGATEEEMKSISDAMANNETAAAKDAASQVIQTAIQKRDETVRAAWDEYDATMSAANGMLESGVITKDEYDAIAEKAKATAEETQRQANEAYYGENGVVAKTKAGLGECSNEIDYETGEQKEQWEVWADDIKTTVGDAWDTAKTKVGETLGTMKSDFDTWCEETGKKWDDYVENDFNPTMEKLKGIADGVGGAIGGFLSDPVGSIKSAWGQISDWFYWNIGKPIEDTFKGIANTVIDALNWMIDGLNNIHIDMPDFVKDTFGVSSIGFSIPRLQRFAQGGFVNEGQLFIANEAGAEMVGSMDGKTAVANNEQITNGIRAAVVEGIVATLPSILSSTTTQNGNGDVVLMMDGKEVARAVNKANQTFVRRGTVMAGA